MGFWYLAPVKLADIWCYPGSLCMGKRSRALCFCLRRGILLPALAGILLCATLFRCPPCSGLVWGPCSIRTSHWPPRHGLRRVIFCYLSNLTRLCCDRGRAVFDKRQFDGNTITAQYVSEQDFMRARAGEWISEMAAAAPIVSPSGAGAGFGATPGLPGPPSACTCPFAPAFFLLLSNA